MKNGGNQPVAWRRLTMCRGGETLISNGRDQTALYFVGGFAPSLARESTKAWIAFT